MGNDGNDVTFPRMRSVTRKSIEIDVCANCYWDVYTPLPNYIDRWSHCAVNVFVLLSRWSECVVFKPVDFIREQGDQTKIAL